MAIDSPTQTGEFSGFLRPDQAAPYFAEATRNSVVQNLVRRVPLGINGVETPVKLSKLKAEWTGEAARKPSSRGALGLTKWRAHKIASIAVVSAEVVRANPGGYMNDIRPEMGEAMGVAFDLAVLHGINSPFGIAENLAAATKSVRLGTSTDVPIYSDLNDALRLVLSDTSRGERKRITGWVFDEIVEPTFNGATDAQNRPIFLEATYEGGAPPVRQGRLLNRDVRMTSHVSYDGAADITTSPVGFGADWTQMVWGTIGGITYDVSSQATVTVDGELVSLWENNLLAIRAEAEFGFKMKPGIIADGPDAGKPGTPADPGGALASVVKFLPEAA